MLDLEKLIQESVKNKNKEAALVYKAIKAEKQKFMSAKNAKPYDDAAELFIIRRFVKQHWDSIMEYSLANRYDLAENELIELNILKTLLPPEISPEDLQKTLTSWCIEQGYETLTQKEMGAAIKALKAVYPNADGKCVADVVKKYIIK